LGQILLDSSRSVSLPSGSAADYRFFKDRAWLRLEFPELIACSEADVGTRSSMFWCDKWADDQAGPRVVLEVGCVSTAS